MGKARGRDNEVPPYQQTPGKCFDKYVSGFAILLTSKESSVSSTVLQGSDVALEAFTYGVPSLTIEVE